MPSQLRITRASRKRGVQATKKVTKIRIAALAKHRVDTKGIRALEKSVDKSLTEKQLMFVRYWASGETPRTAATMAGYSEKSCTIAWRMSRDPAILKLYHEEKKLYEEASGHTKKRVMDMLQEAYDCAKMVSEPASMVAAARELGKMAGHYEPETRININIGGKVLDRMNTMTDDELLKIMNSEGALEGVFSRLADDDTKLLTTS